MAGDAENQTGERLKRRNPGLQARVSGNEFNDQEENVMSNHSTAASNVIPFRFEAKEVRTLLIDDQPWFVASDVSSALQYRDAFNMNRILDEDEKGTQIVSTPGGAQEMLVINESGLYSAILRSRKAEAKRFKKWVTAEVLPAIRKHGRYEDSGNKMSTLMDAMIGMTELSVIKGLIRDKAKAVPAAKQQSFALTMHRRLHTRFNVPRTELIPAGQFEAACNFIGSYALEGEYLGKEERAQSGFSFPIGSLAKRRPDMLTQRENGRAWLDVTINDLRDIRGEATPLESLIYELKEAGFDVEGCWWELRTYRNKLAELARFANCFSHVLESPHRYSVDMEGAA